MTPRTKMRGYGGAALAVLTLTVGWLMVQQPLLKDAADKSSTKADQALSQVTTLTGKVDANAQALAEANGRLIALGKTPVPVPKETPTPPPVVDEFTEAEATEVRLIVADQISRTPAKITQAEITQIARVAATLVPKPKDGKTPTAAELQPIVTATLAAYCAGDKCVGKTGEPGKQGPGGQDAPAVTDAQLLAAAQTALVAYCAQDSKPCVGPAGKDAPPPYSVVDQDCVGNGNDSYWVTYLSNGTDQKTITGAGPCRIGPAPN